MKIVWTDNFARDNVSEVLVASNVREHEAPILLKALEATCTSDNPDWYKLVPDDYELYVFSGY